MLRHSAAVRESTWGSDTCAILITRAATAIYVPWRDVPFRPGRMRAAAVEALPLTVVRLVP